MKKVIILAGGEGIRLRPATYEIPKPLIPVQKKPMINHIIDFFEASDVDEIGIIISKKDIEDFEMWKKNWLSTFSLPIKIFTKNPGVETFSGLRVAKEWIGDKPFVVANGDCLIDFDFKTLTDFHKSHNSIVTAPLLIAKTTGSYGECILNGEHVKGFIIKEILADTTLICGGPYIFDHSVFNYDEQVNDFLNIEKHIFPKLIENKKIIAVKIKNSRLFDCGTLENWEKAIKNW